MPTCHQTPTGYYDCKENGILHHDSSGKRGVVAVRSRTHRTPTPSSRTDLRKMIDTTIGITKEFGWCVLAVGAACFSHLYGSAKVSARQTRHAVSF